MDFDLSPEHRSLLAVAQQVADRMAPGYVEREKAGEYPWKPLAVLADAGLLGLNVTEEAGGQGAGELLTGMVCEILARADYSLPVLVMEAGTGVKLLHGFGSPRLRDRWVPEFLTGRATVGLAFTETEAGSDISAAVSTKARPDGSGGWILSGEKCSMTFAESQLAFVLAATPEGPALLAVPTDDPGVRVAPFDDLGGRQIGRAIVTFDEVAVPRDALIGTPGKGVGAAIRSLGASKVMVAMSALGLAAASLEEALAWATQRRTFGAALASRQGVMFPLVEMSTELEAARLFLHKTLWLADEGKPYEKEAAMAKAWVPALATRICHETMVILGHVAYSREHPAQGRLRDAMGTEYGEGTANVQKMIAARCLTGVNPS